MLGESVRRRLPHRIPRGRDRRRRRVNWKTWLIGIPVALLVPFGLGYLVAVRVLFPPAVMSESGIAVPDLFGRDEAEAQRVVLAAGLGPLEPTFLPHPTAPAGNVIAQSPLPGQQLRNGVSVQVAISAGRPRVTVPDVIGFSAEAATALLRRSGFDVLEARQESAEPTNRVVATDPPPAQVQQLPATITIIISVPMTVDTIVPDTGSVALRRKSWSPAYLVGMQRLAGSEP